MPKEGREFGTNINPVWFKSQVKRYFDVEHKDKPEEWTFGGLLKYLKISVPQWENFKRDEAYKDWCEYARVCLLMKYDLELQGRYVTGAIYAHKLLGFTDEKPRDRSNEEGLGAKLERAQKSNLLA